MIKIKDGRTELYQWDTGSVLTVGEGIDEVHFARSPMGRSITVPAANGEAKIEDVLLQTAGKLFVWGFVGSAEDGYTKLEREFTVRARNKPADYVFTPPEQITMAEILEELKRVQGAVTPEAVGALVEDYLRENPVEGSVQIDDTLTKEGYAADAAKVGEKINRLFGEVDTKQPKGNYALKDEIPSVPVQSVNGKVGDVNLGAADVGAATKEQVDSLAKEIADKADASSVPNKATVNGSALKMQRADTAEDGTETTTDLFEVELPSGGGGADIIDVLMEVEITEAVAAVTVTLDTPRAYKELYVATCIYGDGNNTDAQPMFLRINNTDTMGVKNEILRIPAVENAVSATAKSYGVSFVKVLDDCSFYYSYGSKAANATTPNQSFGDMKTSLSKSTLISSLKFQSINQWMKFGVGSTIKIYGVRA